MKQRMVLSLVFLIVLSAGVTGQAFRILPEMELLAGVQSQTTWIESMGPTGLGNEYFQALQQFFSEYQEHPAVLMSQEFTTQGFSFDAPPAFICHLGSLPNLDLVYEYSPYLVQRAGGRDKLEEFRVALADLALQSGFLDFFAAWEPYLDESLNPSREDFRRSTVQQWLEDFFGWAPQEFQLIMTPSMFPGGGYGATVINREGNSLAFQIIRENGTSQSLPEFPAGDSLENLTIHELGHAFVNPSLEAYPERAAKLRPLLWPVRKTMKSQAYTTVAIFLNEQVIRAMEVVAARDLFELETTADYILAKHESRGFYLTSFVVEHLEFYQANRDLYPTFREVVPYLFDQLAIYQEENSTVVERLMGRFLK